MHVSCNCSCALLFPAVINNTTIHIVVVEIHLCTYISTYYTYTPRQSASYIVVERNLEKKNNLFHPHMCACVCSRSNTILMLHYKSWDWRMVFKYLYVLDLRLLYSVFFHVDRKWTTIVFEIVQLNVHPIVYVITFKTLINIFQV